jgi:D-serine dehydratase
MSNAGSHEAIVASLQVGQSTVWTSAPGTAGRVGVAPITLDHLAEAAARMERFRPALAALFPAAGWDGRVRSELLDYPHSPDLPRDLLIKADHALPMTGSVKARGGVYALLRHVEEVAFDEAVIRAGDDYSALITPAAKDVFARHTVAVSSTGNLGFSIGLVARAFGMRAQIHMSRDAKMWKKERLVRLGAEVVEHNCDFTQTVARGRDAAARSGAAFIDDETSRDLFIGYALAADELISQLAERGITPTLDRPLIVYLPCGVGGAPGGVTFGLKARLGNAVMCVFVEPIASAGMMAALSTGNGRSVSIYDIGLDNDTVADGLAVPTASQFVLDQIGHLIDAVVALPDQSMVEWVGRAWREAGLRLEPSAAASLAAIRPFLDNFSDERCAVNVAWATGGSLLPHEEFDKLLAVNARA